MSLNNYLANSKFEFLNAVKQGKTAEWIVVMGNEAADLDSLSCAIAFGYLTSLVHNQPKKIIPLIQTISKDLYLRPENEFALKSSSIDSTSLLFLDEVSNWQELQGLEIILVDSNRLLPEFGELKVVGVIDHHADEELYQSVTPRIIKSSGSCSSLVTLYFSSMVKGEEWDVGIVDLLLSALLIDTGLKTVAEGGKATGDDEEAANFLIPLSSVALSTNLINPLATWMDRNKELGVMKSNVEEMSGRDLLRRDYKEYEFNGIQYGLATVPVSFEAWLKKHDGNWKDVEKSVQEWMVERNLKMLGVLTTYRAVTKKGKKGDHARELLLRITDEKLEGVFEAVESSDMLKLVRRDDASVEKARVYQQGNDRATRKQLAPLLLSILTSLHV